MKQVILILFLFACARAAYPANVTSERLNNLDSKAEAGNWLTVYRTYNGHRFSPLSQINSGNAGGLKLAWAVPLGGDGRTSLARASLQATPLADNGFLYVTDGWGTVYKIDARSGDRGRIIWKTEFDIDREISRIPSNRGAALWHDLVFTNMVDGRVAAVNAENGEIVWERQVASGAGEGFSGAPLIADDKLIIGQSMGDWMTRGFVAALDPATGNELWRFHTVPAPGQPGSESWKCKSTANADCWKTGGGGVWATGSYDPGSGLYITGTGNPAPAYDPEYRPGDNLYTNSVIALDVDTGKLVWHFQYTPGDYMEFDEAGVHLLVDVESAGRKHQRIVHFGRNGFFYGFDRNNGAFLGARPYVEKITWTAGIDRKTGKPLGYRPESDLQEYIEGSAPRRNAKNFNFRSCPHAQGGVNFWPVSFNAEKNIAYATSLEACSRTILKGSSIFASEETAAYEHGSGELYLGGGYVAEGVSRGSLLAVDVTSGRVVNKIMFEYPNYSGVLATAGNLLFTGHMDGTVSAYHAETLEQLWHINVGVEFQAPPITFAVDDRQYVAILGGGGGIGLMANSFGRKDLQTMETAYVLWVFSL